MGGNRENFKSLPLPGFENIIGQEDASPAPSLPIDVNVSPSSPVAPPAGSRPLFDPAELVQEIRENREEAASLNKYGHRLQLERKNST